MAREGQEPWGLSLLWDTHGKRRLHEGQPTVPGAEAAIG